MGKAFLYQVAELFLKKEGDGIKDLCFVFPNRRSSLFFQKYIGQIADHPVFSPTIVTINTLFSQLSGLRVADKISSLFDLYSEYTLRRESETIEPFDDFLFWGDMLLNDFDDIDKYLVDAGMLFTNIKDLHDIDAGYDFMSDGQKAAVSEFWGNFIPFSDKEKEKSFLSVWNHLFDIYTGFRNSLSERGEGYEGMIYRSVAESVVGTGEMPESLKKYKKIVFVGLNALNKCEKKLLDFLRKEGVADFYWDYYGDIIKDKQNKSSLFMNENIKMYPSAYPLEDESVSDSRPKQQIEVIGVPSAVGQAKYAAKILNSLVGEEDVLIDDVMSTALVLPDENMLLPVLNSVPEKIRKINVTMGYSLKNTHVASFMDLVSQLQRKVRLSGSKISYYHLSVTGILEHPFIVEIVGKTASEKKEEIIKKNMVYVPFEMFSGIPLLELIFKPLSFFTLDKSQMVKCLADYELSILLELQKHVNDIDKEFIYAYYKCINRLKGLNIPIEQDTYFKLLSQIVSSISIPYKGEPLSGLQIMGPLETRALDFDNLIILSVNEGTFPSHAVSSSFIPYNLRKGFDLPNYEFQDSISAYHFYRSIYRAKKVFLLYDTRPDGAGRSGEASRFVKQLKYHHRADLKESIVSYDINTSVKNTISIDKTPQMISILENRYFSASSLNTYLSCPLQFYFQQVEGIQESDEVVEDVEASLFGTLFHSVMEKIYKPYEGKVVEKDAVSELISDDAYLRRLISAAFLKEMEIDEIIGKNKIIEALLMRYVKKTLELDRSSAPFTFYGAEIKCHTKIKLQSAGKDVNLFGVIDRIDLTDGNYRIVDYKTGGYNIKFNQVSELFDTSLTNRPYTAFQMMFYLILLRKTGKIPAGAGNLEMDICSLKDIFKGGNAGFASMPEQYDEFEAELAGLLDNIFNLSIPFAAAGDERSCAYCPYKVICNK